MAKSRTPILFASLLMAFSLSPILASAQTTKPALPAFSKPLPFAQVRLKGELEARYVAATRNLLARSDDRYSLATFASSAAGKPGALWWDWPGDQCGRWYSVLQVAEGYGWPDLDQARQAIADTILPLQTPDGNFGPPGALRSDDARIPSGNAFALRGLMDAYADTHDPRYLEAARKLARYFEKIAPQWATRSKGKLHEFYGHCIDGLVALYEQGGDRSALDLAERLAAHYGRTGHTHHSLSLCRGLIDLARVTGKDPYLAGAIDYVTWCRENQTATGGLPESMPVSEQDEGCGLADWIVVNLMLYAQTGDMACVDAAERTLVNHFAMNQFATGGFGHRSFTQDIIGGKKWQGWDGQFGSENPGCCSLWGQWALGQVGRYIVTETDDVLCVNLYPSAKLNLPKRGLQLEIASDYPRITKAQIRVKGEKPQPVVLALRVPSWAQAIKIRGDGKVLDTTPRAHLQLVSLPSAESGIIDIEFVSKVRLVPGPEGISSGDAIFDGPLCLSLSGNVADIILNWAVLVNPDMSPALDAQGRPQVCEVSSGQIVNKLEPVGAGWQTPDTKDPAKRRILFQTKKAK